MATFHEKASIRRRGEVSMNGRGIVPPTLFTTMSRRPNGLAGRAGQAGHGVEVAQVGGHDDRLAAHRLDLVGHRLELVGGAGGQHHVGPRLGEGERRGGADAAPGAGHHRHLSVESEPVLDHRRSMADPERQLSHQGHP